MEYVLIGMLTASGILFVAYPMLAWRRYRFDVEDMFDLGDVRQLNYLNSKKAAILENLRELDFEYDMGKLSDEDYSAHRSEYLKQAQEVVRAIDKLKVTEEIEELIESDVRQRRRNL